jgi:hypothetical protein
LFLPIGRDGRWFQDYYEAYCRSFECIAIGARGTERGISDYFVGLLGEPAKKSADKRSEEVTAQDIADIVDA